MIARIFFLSGDWDEPAQVAGKIDRGLRLRAPTDRIRRDEDCVKELGTAD